MPSKSKAQHDAMEAAAKGKSTIGIPKTVGQEFAAADKGKKYSARSIADALKKRRAMPAVTEDDETMTRGGYSKRGGGVGSG